MTINENIKLLIDKFRENRLAHIFLVETNNKTRVLEDLKEFIKVINCPNNLYVENCTNCNMCHLISENLLPSLKIIEPDGLNIKKSQMEELKKDFATMPYFSKYNVYVINDVEKFNSSSANTMLKFMEEPEDKIIGFLITNNKENVINTIKSRCEIVKVMYEEDKIEDKESLKQLVCDYLKKIEEEKVLKIVYNKMVMDEKLEKEDMVLFFKYILQVYVDLLNEKEIENSLIFLKKLSKKDIMKRVRLVSEKLDQLNYNVNINLLLDDFVLRLED